MPDRQSTLWIVSEVYYPEEISTGYYITSIAEGLAPHRNVKVLTGQPKHMARGLRAPGRETLHGVEIIRAWGTTLDKNVMLFRLINMATIGMSIFFRSLAVLKTGDHVVVVTAPPSLPVTTALACLLRGATFTLLVQDSYPEILIAVGKTGRDSLFARTVNFFNRWVYKYSSRIIVMGRDMNELFAAKTVGLDVPIITIPNWADLETISPMPRDENKLLSDLGLADKFVLLYAGNMGPPTDIETIVEAAEMLRDSPELHFLFIGAGSKKKWLDEQSSGFKNITVLDYRPRDEQSDFLNACDIGLVALVEGMWGTAMPSRTYNIMAAGKPIIALTDDDSELARVIDEDQIGWHTRPGNPTLLKKLIEDAYKDQHKLAKFGERARNAAIEKYSTEQAVAAYREALD